MLASKTLPVKRVYKTRPLDIYILNDVKCIQIYMADAITPSNRTAGLGNQVVGCFFIVYFLECRRNVRTPVSIVP